MAFRPSSIKKALKNLQEKIKIPFTKEELEEIGNKTVKIIYGVTRTGKNPKTGENILPLNKSTIERRKKVAETNQTTNVFSPSRSNLSLIGALLDSIKAFPNVSEQKVEIYPTGKHPGYVQKNGKKTKGSDNADIMRGQRDMGRDILGLSKFYNRQILTLVKRIYRKKLFKR
jgi:hypothetical protein